MGRGWEESEPVHWRLTAQDARTACTRGSLDWRVGVSILSEIDQSLASTVVTTTDDITDLRTSGTPPVLDYDIIE